MSATDWQEWSRQAVALIHERNQSWQALYSLKDALFEWNTETATIMFDAAGRSVNADLTVVGTVSRSEETFLWGWANDFPKNALTGLDIVREFGRTHGLWLLTTPEWPGGRPELLEMVAVTGRVLDADGSFVDELGDVTIGFVLRNFREVA